MLRAVIERVDLAVGPMTVGVIAVNLAFERDVVGDVPLEAATQPQFARAAMVIQHVVIRPERPGIDGDRLVPRAGESNVRDNTWSTPETMPLVGTIPGALAGTSGVPQ